MSKFKVGDRVIGNQKADARYSITKQGWVGVVTAILAGDRFEAKGKSTIFGESEYELECKYFDLFAPPSKILITTDGKSTLARLYDGNKVIKTAEAKCAQGDTFNFGTGAGIAFDRLMGREKPATVKAVEQPQCWSGKVVCMNSISGVFTAGRLYDFANGAIAKSDSGLPFGKGSIYYPFKTLDDFNKWCKPAQFIEYKGEA